MPQGLDSFIKVIELTSLWGSGQTKSSTSEKSLVYLLVFCFWFVLFCFIISTQEVKFSIQFVCLQPAIHNFGLNCIMNCFNLGLSRLKYKVKSGQFQKNSNLLTLGEVSNNGKNPTNVLLTYTICLYGINCK